MNEWWRFLGPWLIIVLSAACTAEQAEREPDGWGSGGTSGMGMPARSMAGGGGSSAEQPLAAKQAVLWFGLNAATGATCPATRTYQLPDSARATITSSTAVGERIEDGGENVVECSVRPAGDGMDYDVQLRFTGGEIGNFSVRGTLGVTGGELELDFNTSQFGLTQADCMATVTAVTSGAIWLTDLRCPNLRDPVTPGTQCDGQGGLIFENCDG